MKYPEPPAPKFAPLDDVQTEILLSVIDLALEYCERKGIVSADGREFVRYEITGQLMLNGLVAGLDEVEVVDAE